MKQRSLFRTSGLLVAALLGMASTAAMAQTSILSFTSDQGDYIGQGESLTFTSLNATASSNGNTLSISVNDPNHWLYLDFAAPNGAPLAVGTYAGAVRYPFQSPSQPGLSEVQDGRGCNTLTGDFTVLQANFGAYGYVQDFHATYTQHCEGMTPALYGEVEIHNPPPPPALTVSVVVNPQGTVKRQTGQVTLSGTVTCSAATTAYINGTASQRAGRFSIAQGGFSTSTACTTTATPWNATVSSGTATPFNQGQAQVDGTVSAYDPNYGSSVTKNVSTVVNLGTSKK